MAEKVIFHVDMDAFYASVEIYDNPALKGKPVIVGGKTRRGVVSACSYEARRYGVHSAMPLFQARRLCPQGIYTPPRMERYVQISQEIMAFFEDFSPRIIQISVDEAFLDMTGTERLMGRPEEAARKLKERIYGVLPLSLSVGIAPNHYLAKIASDRNKPDGLFRISPGEEEAFMASLPLKDLWGIGEKTRNRLIQAGLTSIRDIRRQSQGMLQSLFGEGTGGFLYHAVRGIDPGIFTAAPKSRSLSTERTLPEDTRDKELLHTLLLELSQQIIFRLYKKKGRSAVPFIKIRWSDFTSQTFQCRLDHPVESAQELYQCAKKLLQDHWEGRRAIRLIGVGLAQLEEKAGSQGELFDTPFSEQKRVEETVWNLKKRFENIPISRGSLISPQKKKPRKEAGD